MNNLACALAGTLGERVALRDVSVSAVLHDLLGEVTVSQAYRNDEQVAIEAVYTFPLSLDAVLLELRVEIGGRVLNGLVVEKKAAEEKYGDAVAAGDAAVMLEEIEPGLYTMNVGNMLPGETATITFSYAILHHWAGDQLRFFLPTTVAPRYGHSRHQPHQAPEHSLTVENQFRLQVEVFGNLREAHFDCPSHEVEFSSSDDRAVISLMEEKAVMDRDFILNVKAPKATRDFALCGADGDGTAAVVSFQPFFPGLRRPQPLTLALVVDCSGSMAGESLAQTKQALEGIFDAMLPDDRITIVAFGSSTSRLWDRPLPCTPVNLKVAREFARNLDANMGGTEIGGALRETYHALETDDSANVLLVTDGEVAAWEAVVKEAKSSGHRIFTVGVGRAVSEAFVRKLATSTGGMCELVSPSEAMAGKVVRHFERMRAPRAKRVAIYWPEGAAGIAPTDLGAVFAGDTVIASAQFDRPTTDGAVVLEVETADGEVTRQEVRLSSPLPSGATDGRSTVARLAASARMKELANGAALETALRYRLISEWTNWLVIAERPEEEKAEGMPAIRKVPQTMAAGWGGLGADQNVRFMRVSDNRLSINYSLSSPDSVMPAFLRALPREPRQADENSTPAWYDPLRRIAEAEAAIKDLGQVFELLREAGMADEFDDLFVLAAQLGVPPNILATIIFTELGGDGDLLPTSRPLEAMERLYEHVQQLAGTVRDVESGMPYLMKDLDDGLLPVLPRDHPRATTETIARFDRIRAQLEAAREHAREASEMGERLARVPALFAEVRSRTRQWREASRMLNP